MVSFELPKYRLVIIIKILFGIDSVYEYINLNPEDNNFFQANLFNDKEGIYWINASMEQVLWPS